MKYFIFGGTNLDVIINSPKEQDFDSTISDISYTPGGVGRNIAVCLSKYNAAPILISCVSNDLFGKFLKHDLIKNQVNIDDLLTIKKERSATYVAKLQEGNMIRAYSDTKIMNYLDQTFLEKIVMKINNNDVVFLDTNLTTDSLIYLLYNCKGKKYVDGVSMSKIIKIRNHFDKIYALKCNLGELEALFGLNLNRLANLKKAIAYLIKNGVKEVIVTLGANGLVYASKKETFVMKNTKIKAINTNGAGDSLFATFCYFKQEGIDSETALKLGISAAILVSESSENVNPDLDFENLKLKYSETKFERKSL